MSFVLADRARTECYEPVNMTACVLRAADHGLR